MSIEQRKLRNHILSSLSHEDFALLAPDLVARTIPIRTAIYESNAPIDHLYFPEAGVVSLTMPGEDPTEVGIVGREGVVGAQIVLGIDRTPLRAFGQIAGDGHAILTPHLQRHIEGSASLRAGLQRYLYIVLMQAAGTAYANGNYTIEQRLARWILMCQDRVGDDIALTHEFMAMMLGCRRPGVTVATHVLEGLGFILAKRGRITVRDREGLAEFADRAYGMAEAEYERLLGPLDPSKAA